LRSGIYIIVFRYARFFNIAPPAPGKRRLLPLSGANMPRLPFPAVPIFLPALPAPKKENGASAKEAPGNSQSGKRLGVVTSRRCA
jgi:hypothetical protein